MVIPLISHFENAADAIISGEIEQLRAMLEQYPDLVQQRSSRAHQSTLLHYVSANGVEDYRQTTPPNIVDFARMLLDAGAEVDATSNAYGGGNTTLGLTATSAHPRLAGVQNALIDLLVERGAAIGEISPDAKTIRYCIANGCPEAALHLVKLGASLDNIYGAAGLGNLDVVRDLFASASAKWRNASLILAAQCDHLDVVQFLAQQGADINANDGMTALHWAAANGNLAMINLLLELGAPLEAENEYGGSVLGSTLWFAYHALPSDFSKRNCPAVFDRLIAAGARTDRYPEMLRDIEGVYQHGQR